MLRTKTSPTRRAGMQYSRFPLHSFSETDERYQRVLKGSISRQQSRGGGGGGGGGAVL